MNLKNQALEDGLIHFGVTLNAKQIQSKASDSANKSKERLCGDS